MLTCVTGKGPANRAHAYKAALDKNAAAGAEPDDGVTAGLFVPGADGGRHLTFNATRCPWDATRSSTWRWRAHRPASTTSMASTHAARSGHRGTSGHPARPDGRKMSKSYDNTIPLFSRAAAEEAHHGHRHRLARARREPKSTEGSNLYQLYQAFASAEETAAPAKAYASASPGRGQAAPFERRIARSRPLREVYDDRSGPFAHRETLRWARPRRAPLPLSPSACARRGSAAAGRPGRRGRLRQGGPAGPRNTAEGRPLRLRLADLRQLLLQSQGFAARARPPRPWPGCRETRSMPGTPFDCAQ